MRSSLIAASCSLAAAFAAPAAAQAPSRVTDALYACADIPGDAERLACFDSAVAELRTAEKAGTVRTVDVAEIERIEREAFGLSLPNLRRMLVGGQGEETAKDRSVREEISEIVVNIQSVSAHPVTKRLTIVLADGQAWEQIDSRRLSASTLRRAKEARIRRAALGSFVMTIDGSVAFRVKRIS